MHFLFHILHIWAVKCGKLQPDAHASTNPITAQHGADDQKYHSLTIREALWRLLYMTCMSPIQSMCREWLLSLVLWRNWRIGFCLGPSCIVTVAWRIILITSSNWVPLSARSSCLLRLGPGFTNWFTVRLLIFLIYTVQVDLPMANDAQHCFDSLFVQPTSTVHSSFSILQQTVHVFHVHFADSIITEISILQSAWNNLSSDSQYNQVSRNQPQLCKCGFCLSYPR